MRFHCAKSRLGVVVVVGDKKIKKTSNLWYTDPLAKPRRKTSTSKLHKKSQRVTPKPKPKSKTKKNPTKGLSSHSNHNCNRNRKQGTGTPPSLQHTQPKIPDPTSYGDKVANKVKACKMGIP